MSNFYTNSEMTDIHFMYGTAKGNASKAARLYHAAYPNRRQPSRRMFNKIHQRLCETGQFEPNLVDCGRPRLVRTPAFEENILRIIEENPGTSCRRIALQEKSSHHTVWKILHDELLHPYHVQHVQALLSVDLQQRITFCQWLLHRCNQDPQFLCNILFTDEASFTRDGINNVHNIHFWGDENPHAIIASRHQHRFSVNVWAGIFGDHLIGPYILPNRLTRQVYLNFLENNLFELLEDIPLQHRQRMWFMHDGAPAHFLVNVRRHLTNRFQERWIGRGGPVVWPPRSPDLNPLDYYLWTLEEHGICHIS